MMKFIAPFLILAAAMLFGGPAEAQSFVIGVTTCGTAPSTIVNGRPAYLTVDTTGKLCDGSSSGSPSTVQGNVSNATSAVAPTATNVPTVAYNYGFNGTTWDQLQVDASKNLKVTGTVFGPTADGSPAANPPILVGGTSDGTATGTVDVWKVDAAGLGYVLDSTGTAIQAPVAPATATATKSALGGCQATSAAINPTTGQQAAVDCDLNNNLLVSSGGAPNFTTSQVTVTTSSTAVCAARALRRACTITAITGTQQIYCSGTTATSANGQLIPAVIGANFTANTTAAINCIALVASQTVSVAETF